MPHSPEASVKTLLDAPAFSVQYHPEAAPGPHDAAGEFDAFCALMEGSRRAQA